MNKGYIKLHRKLIDSLLYQEKPFTRFHAWIDILLNANHTKKDVLMGYKLFSCDSGEQMRSLNTMATVWGWSKTKVQSYINLLVKLNQITTEKDQGITKIKVINWELYQGSVNDEKTMVDQEEDSCLPKKRLTKNIIYKNNILSNKKSIANNKSTSADTNTNNNLSSSTSESASASHKSPGLEMKVSLDFSSGQWLNISEKDFQLWSGAYPAVNLQVELQRAAAWLIANPKNRKSNYKRFLTNWFSRAQDRARPAVETTSNQYSTNFDV